ncbi:hypothetical protein AB0L53_08980 [Nonomuraea sp. NPDC052129]|uniref:hypothetical protein n=1 Tax=Nonomuraea sp. NPDC052129 TaxID=3154651 RepID=UPI003432032B
MRFLDTGLVLDHAALTDWLAKDIEIEVIIAVRRGYPIVIPTIVAAEAARQVRTEPARERLQGLLYVIAHHVDPLDRDDAVTVGSLVAEHDVASLPAAHTALAASHRRTDVGNATDWRIITRDGGPYRRLCPDVPVNWL